MGRLYYDFLGGVGEKTTKISRLDTREGGLGGEKELDVVDIFDF